MTDLIFWILFGVLAGWIASIITNTQGQQKILGNMIVGVLGAVAGGTLMRLYNERGIAGGLSMPSLLTAVCGAIILIALIAVADRQR